MKLLEKMNQVLKDAMKSGRKDEVIVYRTLISDVKNLAIERKSRDEITDEIVIEALTRAKKLRQESVDQFRSAGRHDLADREAAEITLIQNYLPEALTGEELASLVDAAVAESGAEGPRDMGKVMKIIMPKVKGRADGKTLSKLVMEKLGG